MSKVGEPFDVAMGGRIVFRQTGEMTNGELLQFDYFLPPHKVTGGEHLHPKQDERFEVISGTVRGKVDGEEKTAGPGDVSEMPRGMWHLWWNDGDDEAHLLVEVRPALRTAEFFETMAGVEVSEKGIPHPLHGAVVMREYRDEFQPKAMRNPLLRMLVPVLAAVGRMRGYTAEPPEGGPKPAT